IEYTVEVAPECLGTVATGSVGDRIWFDLDEDSIGGDAGDTDGEQGIANVQVLLRECAGGIPGAALSRTFTDSDGFYSFDNLALGQQYCTEVVATTLPEGLSRTNGTGTQSATASLDAGSPNDPTLDFGYSLADATQAALGDEVWVDLDGDGERDANEPGIEGVVIELSTCAAPGTVLATRTTDAAGFYYFGELAPDCYKVTVQASSLPTGLMQTADPDATLDGMATTTLAGGDVDLTLDFGYNEDPNDPVLYCISDYTWYDGDRDGIFDGVNGPDDGTDIALPGVTVTLRNGLGEAVATTVSDANGFFEFCGLVGDDPTTTGTDEVEVQLYVIEITDSAGILDPYTGTTQPGIDGRKEVLVTNMDVDGVNFGYVDEGLLEQCAFTTPTSILGGGANFIDPAGEYQNDLAFDFGCRALYMVGDRVWLNADGDADGGDFGEETGIGSVTVRLTNDVTGATMTTTTEADGSYKFNGVGPGDYTVTVVSGIPAGFVQNFDPDGGITGPFDGEHSFSLAPNLPINFFKTDVDFGYEEPVVTVCLPTVDFEFDSAGNMFSAGDILSTQLAGMTVSTNDPSHPAMIFDT
ncbi:MAG: hypothetical protein EX267_12660, partial [Acidimicrobiia bacterium]